MHYRSYRGRDFMGGSNDPTNSVKALKEDRSKDQASIPSGPLHCAYNNTTTLKQKHTKYTQINTNKSTHSEMGPV